MLRLITKLISSVRRDDHLRPVDISKLVVRYDLVVRFNDPCRNDEIESFSSEDERQEAVDPLLILERAQRSASYDVFANEQDAISEIVLEDCVVFWRNTESTPVLPDIAPPVFEHAPSEQVLLRLTRAGRQKSVLEVTGGAMSQAKSMWRNQTDAFDKPPTEASIIWSRPAVQRTRELVAAD
jgi:hypothetical protein